MFFPLDYTLNDAHKKGNISCFVVLCIQTRSVFKVFLLAPQNQLILPQPNHGFSKKSYLPRKIRHFEKIKNVFSWILSLQLELTFDQKSESEIFTQPIQNVLGFICPISQIMFLSADIKQRDTEKNLHVLILGLAKTYIFNLISL